MGKSIKLTRISTLVDQVAYEVRSLHFSGFCSLQGWRPALNAYRYIDHYEICMDLAGVDVDMIDLQVESHRLTVQGHRPVPEPKNQSAGCQQILSMEIESGEFVRVVDLPTAIDARYAEARQENGLLRIHLPVRPPA